MALRVWLPLNKDLHNQGLNNCTITNNGTTITNYYAHIPTRGLIFQSSELGNPEIKSGKTFSVAFWVKGTWTTSTQYIIACSAWEIRILKTYIKVNEGGSGAYANVMYESTLEDDKWYHIAFTWDGTINKFSLFVDGICRDEKTITPGNYDISSTINLVYSGPKDMFDFRIYDHALSKKEVAELARGCILHYPMNDTKLMLTKYPSITWNQLVQNGDFSDGKTGWISLYPTGNFSVQNNIATIIGRNTYEYIYQNIDYVVGHKFYTRFDYSSSEVYNGSNLPYGHCFIVGNDIGGSIKQNATEANKWNTYSGIFTANSFTWKTDKFSFFGKIGTDVTGRIRNVYLIDLTLMFGAGNEPTSEEFLMMFPSDYYPYDTGTTIVPEKILKDVSGFDNHSLITGSLPLVTTPKSPRYDKCMNIDNSGTNKNYANCTIAAPQVKSASFWVYIGSSFPSGTNILFLDYPSQVAFGFYQGTSCILVCNGSNNNIACKYVINDKVKLNSWNHFCHNVRSSDNTTDLWINGVKLTNTPVIDYWTNVNRAFDFGLRRYSSDTYTYFNGKVSDFRLFSRVLTLADVDDLYKDSLVIDKNQNGFTYELNESDSQTSVDVKKNGQLKCKNYYEACPDTYDSNIYTEPDGSQWIRIFHHNNPANALFSSSDTFTTGVYKDADRWFKVSLCNNVSKWELMIKQKLTSSSSIQKYRWVQQTNPMSGTYADTVADNIAKYTNSQGYTDIAPRMGGIYHKGGQAYLTQNNSNNGNWYGAAGSWTDYSGGIPAFCGEEKITNGFADIYLRIDNLVISEVATLFTEDSNQVTRIGKNSNVTFNEIKEV